MPRGADIGMGRGNGERFLDRRREKPKKKAEATAESVCFAPILWTSHWHKGLRQGQYPWIASPGAELLGVPSTLRAREAVGCLVSGAFCFLPVLSLSSRKKQRKGSGWKRHVFVMSYLERRQSEKGA